MNQDCLSDLGILAIEHKIVCGEDLQDYSTIIDYLAKQKARKV